MCKILGINDDVTTCECCGRTNLKCTVVLELAEGETVHYGRDCAARKLYGANKSSEVKTVESIARGMEYAKKWLHKTESHTAALVANAIRVRFCACHVIGDFSVEFSNGVIFSA